MISANVHLFYLENEVDLRICSVCDSVTALPNGSQAQCVFIPDLFIDMAFD